jgi:hypothetical protein
MTSTQSTTFSEPKLLIALSKGFAYRRLFEQKLKNILSALDFSKISVDVGQDDFSIAKDFFQSSDIKLSEVKIASRGGLQKQLKNYAYVVIFWDGENLTDLVYTASLLKIPLRLIPVQVAKVKNKNKDEEFDIYIGRGTPWGNPFPIGIGETGDSRDDVMKKFKTHFEENILGDPTMLKSLLSLKGLRLGCHCKPQACHGDIIAEFLNSYEIDRPGENEN